MPSFSNRKLPSPKNQIKMVTRYKLVYTQNRFLLTFFLHILEEMNMSPAWNTEVHASASRRDSKHSVWVSLGKD